MFDGRLFDLASVLMLVRLGTISFMNFLHVMF